MFNIAVSHYSFLRDNWLFAFAVLLGSLTPFCMLIVPGGGGFCFFLLLALSVLFFLLNRKWPDLLVCQGYPWFFTGLILWFLLIIIQMTVTGGWSGRNFEPILRFLSGLVILPFLAHIPSTFLKKIDWGIALAAIAACIYAIVSVFILSAGRAANYFTCAIAFGNISLLLSFWSLMFLYWDENPSQLKKSFKIVVFFMGLYTSFLSGSRGGWLAIPLFILIAVSLFRPRKIFNKKDAVLFLVGFIILGATSANFVSHRITPILDHVKSYQGGDVTSSAGQRLELWKGSIHTFKQNPILGVGQGKFQKATKQLAEKKVISEVVTVYKHAHNEVLFMMAEFGVGGLIVVLGFYFCIFMQFFSYCRHPDVTIKTAAYLGLTLSAGLVVFGLTEVIFVKVKEIGFFIVMICLFLGIITSRQRELEA